LTEKAQPKLILKERRKKAREGGRERKGKEGQRREGEEENINE
jgi:hypothetical protein